MARCRSDFRRGSCSGLQGGVWVWLPESIFKREERGKWVLVRVAFHLDRESPLRMGYGAIEQELAHIPVDERPTAM